MLEKIPPRELLLVKKTILSESNMLQAELKNKIFITDDEPSTTLLFCRQYLRVVTNRKCTYQP
jgi:hypothetical protein